MAPVVHRLRLDRKERKKNSRMRQSFLRTPAFTRILVVALGHLVAAASRQRTPTVLDLSYQHNLGAAHLTEVIRDYNFVSEDSLEEEEENRNVLEVDVSNSCLGDVGFREVAAALLQLQNNNNKTAFRLTARSNALTAPAVARFIEDFLLPNTTNLGSASSSARNESTEEKGEEESSGPSSVQNQNTTTAAEEEAEKTPTKRILQLESLDLSWNHLPPGRRGSKNFHKALEKLVSNPISCPKILRLDRCGLGPAACRAVSKGLIHRYTSAASKTLENGMDHTNDTPLTLHLCGNPAVGDAGAAAMAAAIRTIATALEKAATEKKEQDFVILERLDLSACDIGDPGVESLAVALESLATSATSRCCIRHLDLSNNPRITDQGASALGRALTLASNGAESNGHIALVNLDLSGNTKIGDQGAVAISSAIEQGCLLEVSLRSCQVCAKGASAFGRALRALLVRKVDGDDAKAIKVDLSGNPLGVLRGKSKNGPGKYSASHLKSKASATAASYMSFLTKNLKDAVGVDVSQVMGINSAESDDEEEEKDPSKELGIDGDLSRAPCGAKAFAAAFLDEDNETDEKQKPDYPIGKRPHLAFGLRRSFLDHGAADALAAVLVTAKNDMGIDIELDVNLNPVLEEDMVLALHSKEEEYDNRLREMAERHSDQVEALRVSRQRAKEAAKLAEARMEAESKLEDTWDAPNDYYEEERGGRWDSDSDYEQGGEYDDRDYEVEY